MLPLMLTDKPKIVVETLAEPPARPPGALYPGPPSSVHWHHCTLGHAHEVDYGAAQYSKLLASQCAYCSSSLDEGSNESGHDCKNKPAVVLALFEEVPWPFGFPLPSESRPRLVEPPIT